MKRMVYFCPVDWRWIKQRPQFLAEELSRYYEMQVVYPFSKNRKGLQKAGKDPIRKTPYLTLPTLGGRLKIAEKINKQLVRLQTGLIIRKAKPDVLWITLPEQTECIPAEYRGSVIYDCMDDYAAFSAGSSRQSEIIRMEGELVRRADLVFASSGNLRDRLCERYDLDSSQIVILRNGYNAKWGEKSKGDMRTGRIRIGYFGTISHWFDFELLMNSLKSREDMEYHLYGPVAAGVQIPQNERIICHGVVEHDEIERCAAGLDALMMPFVLNDLVRSVDPVKLYEYIWMEKNILCIRYPEIERFEPFVLFYQTQEEFMKQLEIAAAGGKPKYTHEQAVSFLAENNWETRAAHAAKYINGLIKHGGEK